MSGFVFFDSFVDLLYSIVSNNFTQLIAILTIYIAILQYMSSKYKLKMDLYERRLKIYCVTREILHQALTTAKIEQDMYKEFDYYIAESLFLFNKNMYDYLYHIYLLLKSDITSQKPDPLETHSLSEKQEKIAKIIIQLPDKFSNYLSMNKLYNNGFVNWKL